MQKKKRLNDVETQRCKLKHCKWFKEGCVAIIRPINYDILLNIEK